MKRIFCGVLLLTLLLTGCNSVSKEEYEGLLSERLDLEQKVSDFEVQVAEQKSEIEELTAQCDSMFTKEEYNSILTEKNKYKIDYETTASERDDYKRKYQDAAAENATLKEKLEKYEGLFDTTVIDAASTDDFEYVNTGKGVQINKYIGKGGKVVIPDLIDGVPVLRIASGAFEDHPELTGIVFPRYLEFIGDHAFFGAKKLTGVVVIPEKVAEIDGHAFQRTDITGLVIKSDCNIDINAFANIYNLEFIYVKSGCAPKIGTSCFGYNGELKTAVFPSSMLNIKDETFAGCTKMTIYCPKDSYANKYADKNYIWCDTENYEEMDKKFAELY